MFEGLSILLCLAGLLHFRFEYAPKTVSFPIYYVKKVSKNILAAWSRYYRRIVFRVINRYYRWAFQKQKAVSSQHVAPCDEKELMFLDNLICKDESWSHVENLKRIAYGALWRGKIRHEGKGAKTNKVLLDLVSRSLWFNSQQYGEDWIYCYTQGVNVRDFRLKFDLTQRSVFTELQVAFRHIDIVNRYRFRTIDNRNLVFEVVRRGQFHHRLCNVPFSFVLGRRYAVEICSYANCFYFIVDGKLIMSVKAKISSIPNGGFAFIMWNRSGCSDIRVSLDNIQLFCI